MARRGSRSRVALAATIVVFATSLASAQAPRPLPAELHAEVHLPGSDPNRHLRVTVDIGRGAAWVIEGCVTDAGGRCTRTRAVELTAAERQEYVRLWAEIRAIPRCEMDAIWPGDRNWVLTSSQGRWSGRLPADRAAVAERTRGPCRADARMAFWIAERFTSR